jgi:hypothetical protein
MEMMSLTELLEKFRKEREENERKSHKHVSEIYAAPKNTVQMPKVKKSTEANKVQQPVIQKQTVIPPKTGGCGCWGNK